MQPVTLISAFVPDMEARSTGTRQRAVMPPAQLTSRKPSSSESMFSMMRDLRSDISIAAAPSMPISSSTVSTHSSGGCGMVSESRMASMYAAAMPSSPPRVVPSAVTIPFSRRRRRPSFAKSMSHPASFSQTMSIWPCSMTGAAFSYPEVPCFRMITLLYSSCRTSSPRSFANCTQ